MAYFWRWQPSEVMALTVSRANEWHAEAERIESETQKALEDIRRGR